MGRLDKLHAGIQRMTNDTPFVSDDDRERELRGVYVEAVTAALVDLTERLEAVLKPGDDPAPLIETLADALKAHSKSIGEHIKANNRVVEQGVKALQAQQGIDLGPVVAALEAIANSAPQPIEPLPAPEQKPVEFQIQRDGNQFIKSVIARPVP